MPIDGYYSGDGTKVLASMKKTYGRKKGKEVFYATAEKKGLKPKTARKSVARKSA